MTDRILAVLREIFLSWDRYTALQLHVPTATGSVR
jgi:hypothetical protein